MASAQKQWIGLIRGIGPTTHKKMSMQDLREACTATGLGDVKTLLATGNLLFTSRAVKRELHATLVDVLAQFDLNNAVFLRTPKELIDTQANNPLTSAASTRPNKLLVLFLQRNPRASEIKPLLAHQGPEQVKAGKKVVYIDYKDSIARSKLTPDRLERTLGQVATARNWNTLNKLIKSTQTST